MKYKHIYIKQVDNELFNGKPVYRIFNNKSTIQLAILSYYKPWKKYVFSSQDDSVFDNNCLKDIVDFLENQIKGE